MDAFLFDTHAHLDDTRFDNDREAVIERMREAGVRLCMTIGADVASAEAAVRIAEGHEQIYAAVGIHPHEAGTATPEALQRLRAMAASPKVKAIGEIGLDYHYDLSPREKQKEAFAAQLDLAVELGLPAVIHIREAHGDALALLKARKQNPKGVIHCYSGSLESAQEYLRLGFLISFTGSVTFKNAVKLAEVARVLPLESLMVETDSPYMAPVPLRGRRNEPAYVREVARFLATLKGVDETTLWAQTTQNGRRLFGL